MRQRGQRQDLYVLRISLALSEDTEQENIAFELSHGGDSIPRLVSSKKLGLPASTQSIRRLSYAEPSFFLPDEVIAALKEFGPKYDPLWIELDPPGSRLAIVPWERLLQPYLQAPILRLPFFPISGPLPKWESLDVVLCASSPVAKAEIPLQYITDLARTIVEASSKPTTIHLFSDLDNYEALREIISGFLISEGSDRGEVRVYNPQDAANYMPAEFSRTIEDDPQRFDNPWLNWIADSLGTLTVDVAHFACHGFFSTDQGSIAVAESPLQNRDSDWARFIGAQQLNNFLNRVGAGAVFFSSPPQNFSISGLRVLNEQMARLRLGFSLLHEASEDMGLDDLRYIYHILYCPLAHDSRPFKALSFYCSPDSYNEFITEGERRSSAVEEAIPAISEIAEILSSSSKSGNTWIASSYRWLEETSSALAEQPISERQTQTQAGIRNALNFLSDVTQRHARLRNLSLDRRDERPYEQEAE